MRVRPMASTDLPAIQALLRLIWGSEGEAGAYYRFGGSHPTLVVERGGQLVGMGSIWRNRIHPEACYFGLHLHPDHRRQGLGSALLQELALLNREGHPLQTSVWEVRAGSLQFLRRHGFQEIRRTYITRLTLLELNRSAYAAWTIPGYQIQSLVELSTQLGWEERLATLCREVYQATHQANPAAELPLTEWAKLALADADLAGSFVALREGRWAAFSLLHEGEEPSSLELGWRGTADWAVTQLPSLIKALTLRQLQHAQERGCLHLSAEVDSTDPGAMIQMEYLPFQPAPTWITFRRGGQATDNL